MISILGMSVIVMDAQRQARTTRDVRGPRVRPKVPSKAAGRRSTRRNWKRRHPPHFVMLYREPADVLCLRGTIIATPAQADVIRRQTTLFEG
jgi:hypothetical protein